MTALCAGGTSQPKTGLDTFVTYSAGAIALLLQARGGGKLIPLIPLLGLAPLELGNLCTSDPPALPTLTADEVFSLLLLRLDSDYFIGLAKFRDLVTRMLWYELCECTAGSPTAFVNPTLPTDTPDPVGPVGTNPGPCLAATYSHSILAGAGDITDTLVGLAGIGATLVEMTCTATPHTAAQSSNMVLSAVSDTGAVTGLINTTITNAAQGPITRQFALPANVASLTVVFHSAGNSGTTYAMAAEVSVFCGGNQPNQLPQPCCPPDTATQAYLDQILAMVTLIQRQAAPFAYVYGSNHTGLTGHGSFAVSGLVGISVDVVTLPSNYGQRDGSPVELFDLGFVTLGTADGYETSRRIDHDGTLLLPPSAGVFSTVGYSLSAGVEVDIRGLVREP